MQVDPYLGELTVVAVRFGASGERGGVAPTDGLDGLHSMSMLSLVVAICSDSIGRVCASCCNNQLFSSPMQRAAPTPGKANGGTLATWMATASRVNPLHAGGREDALTTCRRNQFGSALPWPPRPVHSIHGNSLDEQKLSKTLEKAVAKPASRPSIKTLSQN